MAPPAAWRSRARPPYTCRQLAGHLWLLAQIGQQRCSRVGHHDRPRRHGPSRPTRGQKREPRGLSPSTVPRHHDASRPALATKGFGHAGGVSIRALAMIHPGLSTPRRRARALRRPTRQIVVEDNRHRCPGRKEHQPGPSYISPDPRTGPSRASGSYARQTLMQQS